MEKLEQYLSVTYQALHLCSLAFPPWRFHGFQHNFPFYFLLLGSQKSNQIVLDAIFNPLFLLLQLDTKTEKIIIIQIYAPTVKLSDEQVDQFHEKINQLQKVYRTNGRQTHPWRL